MRKFIITEQRKIFPFNERARDLRILNRPLWLLQRDVLARHTSEEHVVESLAEVDLRQLETFVYRDNLFFDRYFIDEFLTRARATGEACRVAFALDDAAIATHALALQENIRREDDVYVADMWFFPNGVEAKVRRLVIDVGVREMGCYHVPTHMSNNRGELVYQVPLRAFCSIEHWVHTVTANVIFGVFANGARMDLASERLGVQTKLLWRSMLERKQSHSCSEMVQVGRNCSIDPTAIIKGPTHIGNNVTIGPGAVVDVSVIGDNVALMNGVHVQLSVISDRCYLPFRAAVFMSSMMEDSMLAQNTCVQFCSIGRNTFIGAGSTFTDFNLVPKPIRASQGEELGETGMPVLGGCVGHNCYIGSGMVVYPARAIESDVILFASAERRVIDRNVTYDQSDHFRIAEGELLRPRQYPR